MSDVFRLGDEVAQMLPLWHECLDQRKNCDATCRELYGETLPNDVLKYVLGQRVKKSERQLMLRDKAEAQEKPQLAIPTCTK
jgi:hypothetical protein